MNTNEYRLQHISVITMGSVETLHVSSLGPLEVGGSQEQYSQKRGGGQEEAQAFMRTWHKAGQPQPPKLSQGLEKNNPDKWNWDKKTEFCPPPNPSLEWVPLTTLWFWLESSVMFPHALAAPEAPS